MNNKSSNYDYLISELIDLLSIMQIKEIKFNNKRKIYSKQMKDISVDINKLIRNKKIDINGEIIRKIAFVGISNLLVWELKDLMLSNKKDYDKFLQKALELNIIRNKVFNTMMIDFNEFDETRQRNETLNKRKRKWCKSIMNSFDNQ